MVLAICKRCLENYEKIFRLFLFPPWKSRQLNLGNRLENQVSLLSFIRNFDFDVSKFFTVPAENNHKHFRGKKLVGFSMEELYSVAADVKNYERFVPFCKESSVKMKNESELWGRLVIGFPPVMESYTSHVTLRRPTLVKADCSDGELFTHLTSVWAFAPGVHSQPRSCIVDFSVSFGFKSKLHAQLANLFFAQLVKQMEAAFFKEAQKRFGPPSIKTIQLKLPS